MTDETTTALTLDAGLVPNSERQGPGPARGTDDRPG